MNPTAFAINSPMSPMHGPNLLIIGAMKSGTTSLASCLAASPDIAFPAGKEAGVFSTRSRTTEEQDRILTCFRKAWGTSRFLADASPTYTLGFNCAAAAHVAARASPDVRLIYILRDPVARAVSHYNHLYQRGVDLRPIDDALRSDPLYLGTSRYATHLQLWFQHFPPHHLHVVIFEEFIRDRYKEVAHACDFLGIPCTFELPADEVQNATRGRRGLPARSVLRPAVQAGEKVMRHLLPAQARRRLKRYLLPRMPAPRTPSPETLDWMWQQLQEELRALRDILGADAPSWCQGESEHA